MSNSPAEPIWVLEEVVSTIHELQIAEHGGRSGIRDKGLLASALARPLHLFIYAEVPPDLAALAAAYAFGIARNHPFIDGNKRTALVVCRLFLSLNGRDIDASQEEKYQIFLGLAEGSVTEETLAFWLRSHFVEG